MHPITTDHPAVNASPPAGEKLLIDKTTGARYPAAPTGSLLLTSAPFGWRGIIVEQHRLTPAEMPEHSVIGHGISVNVSAQPTSFAWTRGRDGWNDRPTNPGHCRILTHGESHPTRWLQPYNEVSLIIDPRFAADVVEDGLPTDRIAFVTRHSVADSVIVDYATTLRAELAADAPNRELYAETLTVGLVLHLLANHAVAKPKVPAPAGKLNAHQLRAVVDCTESRLDEDVSLIALAQRAHVSPFHFARLFRTTVGLPPHQFVVRLRIERALHLMRSGAAARPSVRSARFRREQRRCIAVDWQHGRMHSRDVAARGRRQPHWNLLGMKHQIPAMLKNGGDPIVNLTSVAASQVFEGYPVYSASKWGVVGVTKVAAKEFASQRIRVNAIAPGSIDTPLFSNVVNSTLTSRADYERQTPMGRIARSEEVAATATWVCSEAASYNTGRCCSGRWGMTL